MNSKFVGLITTLLIIIISSIFIYTKYNHKNDLENKSGLSKDSSSLNKHLLNNDNSHLSASNFENKNNVDDKSTILASTDKENIDAELQARLDAINKRRPDLNLTADQLQALINKPTAWHTDPSVAKDLSSKLRAGDAEDGRVFIKFDPLKIETLAPNDKLQIPIPHMNDTFVMRVDEVDTSEPYITVWRGRLEDFGEINRVNIVQANENGDTVTHIGINTPEGFYVTDVYGDKGWIVPGGILSSKGKDLILQSDNHSVKGE